MRRYARSLLRDREAADDLVQDSLERALSRMDRWTTGESPRRWLFTIMHHLFVDQLRRTKRHGQIVAMMPETIGGPATPPPQDDKVESREVLEALQKISPGPARCADAGRRRRLFLRGGGQCARRPRRNADVADRARARGSADDPRRRLAAQDDQGGRQMSRRDFTLNDIHLALDGELSADDRADFEHWLDAHPDMKALKARYERDRATLAAALAPVLDEPVPARLDEGCFGRGAAAPLLGCVLRARPPRRPCCSSVGAAAGYVSAPSIWPSAGRGPDRRRRHRRAYACTLPRSCT